MCFQFVVLISSGQTRLCLSCIRMSVIRVTFSIRNLNLIDLGGEKVVLQNAADNSVIADLCHVAWACGYRSYVGTDDLSLCRPADQTFQWQLKFWTLWCCGMFRRIIWYTATKAVEGPLDAVRSSKLLACRRNWKTSHVSRPSPWHVTAWDADLRCYLSCFGHLLKSSKWRTGHSE